jgi:glycerol-3-phosphate dehydrogenase
VTVVGTTDDDFYGDLDEVRATSEEVRYLVQGIARVFPAIRSARAISTTAAVRPTLYAFGPAEDALSREHQIVDHAAHGAPGLYSMIGGKLASYRLFAEEMTDILAARFDIGVRGSTHTSPLPGGDAIVDPFALAERMEIDAVAARRVVYRHGSRATLDRGPGARRPREAATVCACEPVIEAEVRYVLQNELARSVADVSRRTRLGVGACGGMRCAARCGQIVAQELGSAAERGGAAGALVFVEARARSGGGARAGAGQAGGARDRRASARSSGRLPTRRGTRGSLGTGPRDALGDRDRGGRRRGRGGVERAPAGREGDARIEGGWGELARRRRGR